MLHIWCAHLDRYRTGYTVLLPEERWGCREKIGAWYRSGCGVWHRGSQICKGQHLFIPQNFHNLKRNVMSIYISVMVIMWFVHAKTANSLTPHTSINHEQKVYSTIKVSCWCICISLSCYEYISIYTRECVHMYVEIYTVLFFITIFFLLFFHRIIQVLLHCWMDSELLKMKNFLKRLTSSCVLFIRKFRNLSFEV